MFPDQMTLAAKCIRASCKIGGITIAMLDSRIRTDQVAFVRHMIAYALTQEGLTTKDIGALINRCRGDVTHAVQSFQGRIDTDKRAKARYQKLKEALWPQITNRT